MKAINIETIYAGILGVAVGDAVGVPYEFLKTEDMKKRPATDMASGGIHGQPKGFWSDDTSMTLAMMDAMSTWENKEDYDAVMKNFSAWYYDSEYTPDNDVFDCGTTCSYAVHNYKELGKGPDECGVRGEYANGNGALMRILPALFYVHSKYGEAWVQNKEAISIIEKLTALTHAHKRSSIASVMYLSVAEEILKGKNKDEAVKDGIASAKVHYLKEIEGLIELNHFVRVSSPDFKDMPEEDMRSGGYVIESIEAAIWCFLNTDSYRECILKAVNLGHDTDTTAAIVGGLAGLYYGLKDIPVEWLQSLARLGYIKELCDKYAETID